MRKTAILSTALALVAVSFFGCDQKAATEPQADYTPFSDQANVGHANLVSTTGVPMAYLGGSGWPRGANGRGQVVGQFHSSGRSHACVWQDGVRTSLPELDGWESSANAINNKGQIVGGSRDADGNWYAVLWENGSIRKLNADGAWNSFAADINEMGQVCGAFISDTWHAVIWEDEAAEDLGFEGSCEAINSRGQVAGIDYTGVARSVLWDDGELLHLLPPGHWSGSFDINESGRVLIELDDEPVVALIWDRGELRNLGSLGTDAYPTSINSRGQVTGYSWVYSETFGWRPLPFVWEHGAMTDLGGTHADCEGLAFVVADNGAIYGEVSECNGVSEGKAVVWYP